MGWLPVNAFLLLALLEVFGGTEQPSSESQEPTSTVYQHSAMTEGYPAPQGGVGHVQPQAGVVSTPSPSLIVQVGGGVGGIRRTLSGWREWRRADPTLINSLWRSKMGNGIRKQLGNAEVYIMLALLIGLVTVVIGCWLSDNCWSPEPEGHVMTVA